MAPTNRQSEERANLICPKCQYNGMRRVRRQGWLERELLPRLGFYPWECIDCRQISMIKMRKAPAALVQAEPESYGPLLPPINPPRPSSDHHASE